MIANGRLMSIACITKLSQIVCNILVHASLYNVYHVSKTVAAVVGTIVIVGVLTHCTLLHSVCDSKIAQIDVHHDHVVPLAQIALTLSCHFSLLFIASGRSSGLHLVSSHSGYMYVQAGRPAFAWPYAGVHRSTSLTSLSLLLQQCPACLVHLTWIVFVMGGRWPYSWYLVGCCHQDLFNIVCNILV